MAQKKNTDRATRKATAPGATRRASAGKTGKKKGAGPKTPRTLLMSAMPQLLIHTVNGNPVAPGMTTGRPCTIIGVHNYGTMGYTIEARLHGAGSSTPIVVSCSLVNFRWDVMLQNPTVAAGDYLVEIVLMQSGMPMTSQTFSVKLT